MNNEQLDPRDVAGFWERERMTAGEVHALNDLQCDAIYDAVRDTFFIDEAAYTSTPYIESSVTPEERRAVIRAAIKRSVILRPLTADEVFLDDQVMSANATAGLSMPVLMELVRAVERLTALRLGAKVPT